MSSIAQLKQIIQTELNARKVYKEALDVVLVIEGLEQNEKELSASVYQLKASRAVLFDELDALKDSIEAVNQKAKDTIASANAEAEKIIAEAKDKAAKAHASALAELEAVVAQTNTARVEAQTALAEADTARIALNEINTAVEQAKATARKVAE